MSCFVVVFVLTLSPCARLVDCGHLGVDCLAPADRHHTSATYTHLALSLLSDRSKAPIDTGVVFLKPGVTENDGGRR